MNVYFSHSFVEKIGNNEKRELQSLLTNNYNKANGLIFNRINYFALTFNFLLLAPYTYLMNICIYNIHISIAAGHRKKNIKRLTSTFHLYFSLQMGAFTDKLWNEFPFQLETPLSLADTPDTVKHTKEKESQSCHWNESIHTKIKIKSFF